MDTQKALETALDRYYKAAEQGYLKAGGNTVTLLEMPQTNQERRLFYSGGLWVLLYLFGVLGKVPPTDQSKP